MYTDLDDACDYVYGTYKTCFVDSFVWDNPNTGVPTTWYTVPGFIPDFRVFFYNSPEAGCEWTTPNAVMGGITGPVDVLKNPFYCGTGDGTAPLPAVTAVACPPEICEPPCFACDTTEQLSGAYDVAVVTGGSYRSLGGTHRVVWDRTEVYYSGAWYTNCFYYSASESVLMLISRVDYGGGYSVYTNSVTLFRSGARECILYYRKTTPDSVNVCVRPENSSFSSITASGCWAASGCVDCGVPDQPWNCCGYDDLADCEDSVGVVSIVATAVVP